MTLQLTVIRRLLLYLVMTQRHRETHPTRNRCFISMANLIFTSKFLFFLQRTLGYTIKLITATINQCRLGVHYRHSPVVAVEISPLSCIDFWGIIS